MTIRWNLGTNYIGSRKPNCGDRPKNLLILIPCVNEYGMCTVVLWLVHIAHHLVTGTGRRRRTSIELKITCRKKNNRAFGVLATKKMYLRNSRHDEKNRYLKKNGERERCERQTFDNVCRFGCVRSLLRNSKLKRGTKSKQVYFFVFRFVSFRSRIFGLCTRYAIHDDSHVWAERISSKRSNDKHRLFVDSRIENEKPECRMFLPNGDDERCGTYFLTEPRNTDHDPLNTSCQIESPGSHYWDLRRWRHVTFTHRIKPSHLYTNSRMAKQLTQ